MATKRSLAVGTGVLVLALLVPACGDGDGGGPTAAEGSQSPPTTSPAPPVGETTEGVEYEILPAPPASGRLLELHSVVIIEEQVPVLEVEFEQITFFNPGRNSVAVEMRVIGVLWAPPLADAPEAGASVTATMRRDGETLLDAEGRSGVAIVDSSGALLAAAVYAQDGEFSAFRPGVDHTGLEFLATALDQMGGVGWLEALATFDRCAAPEPETLPPSTVPLNHRQELLDFLTTLGDRTIGEFMSESRPDGSAAEQIALDSGAVVDPVVGDAMDADEDYIRFQLENGVPEDQLEIRYVIPLGWDLAGISNPAESQDRMYLYDGVTGRLLATGAIRALAGAAEPFTEVSAPDAGNPVHVFVLGIEHRAECGPPEGVAPDIVVPYGDFAGSGRVVLEVGSQSYRPLTASEYGG